MKLFQSIIFLVCAFLVDPVVLALPDPFVQDQKWYNSSRLRSGGNRIRNVSLEGVDFTSLQEEARRSRSAFVGEDLEKLVLSNFSYIFHNKLNRRVYRVTPDPQDIVGRIVNILRLNAQLRDLIGRGRELVVVKESNIEKLKLVRMIEDLSGRIRGLFRHHFLDPRGGGYTFSSKTFDSKDHQFTHYIVLSDRISRLLSTELDHYFFNSMPGVVEVSDFEQVSIQVLTKSLNKASSLAIERLQR